jgi:hypothetical protein
LPNVGAEPLLLLDTVGFGDPNISEIEILFRLCSAIKGLHDSGVEVKGIIYVHDINSTWHRIADLTREMLAIVIGPEAMRNTIILLNKCDRLRTQAAIDNVVRSLRRAAAYGSLVNDGAEIVQWEGTSHSAISLLEEMLTNRLSVTLNVPDSNAFSDTAALQGYLDRRRRLDERPLTDEERRVIGQSLQTPRWPAWVDFLFGMAASTGLPFVIVVGVMGLSPFSWPLMMGVTWSTLGQLLRLLPWPSR